MSQELPTSVVVIATAQAKVCALPLPFVLAVIQVESGGDTFAWNPEPHYRYLYNVRRKAPFRALTAAEKFSEQPPADFPSLAGDRDAEWWGQQASWGLMQVMGAVARELGMRGHIPSLCDPQIGIRYGCMHLANLVRRFHAAHGWRGVGAAFNAGSPRYQPGTTLFENQVYVDKLAKAGAFLGGM